MILKSNIKIKHNILNAPETKNNKAIKYLIICIFKFL